MLGKNATCFQQALQVKVSRVAYDFLHDIAGPLLHTSLKIRISISVMVHIYIYEQVLCHIKDVYWICVNVCVFYSLLGNTTFLSQSL